MLSLDCYRRQGLRALECRVRGVSPTNISLLPCLLGGSWVVISRVISRITVVITHLRGLIINPT